MGDSPPKEVVALGRSLIETISKSSVVLSERVLFLLSSAPLEGGDRTIQMPYPSDVCSLFTQLHVAYNTIVKLCQDLIERTPPDSENIVMEPETFATLLELSTSTKIWENELLRYNFSLTLQ